MGTGTSADDDAESTPPLRRLGRALKTGRGRAVAAALVLAVAGAGWVAYDQSASHVTSKDLSFAFPAEGTATVEFTVTKRPSVAAQCAVQVLNEQHAIVGWAIVDIPSNARDAAGTTANGSTTQHKVTVRTVSEGVNGSVNSCWRT